MTLPQGIDQDDVVDALVQTSFVTMGVLTRIAAEHDVSLTQIRVLAILRDRRLGMTALAAYLGLEKSTMSGLVDRAEQRGLMTRGRNPDDGRVVEVFLTDAGRDLVTRARIVIGEQLAPLTSTLTAGEQARLQELLERMLDATG